jgi:hypothetical protein
LTVDFSVMEIESLEERGCGVFVSHFCHFMQYKAISFCSGNYICSIVLPKSTAPVRDPFFSSLRDLAKQKDCLGEFNFIPELVRNYPFDHLVPVIPADRDPMRFHEDLVAFNTFYLVDGDNIGFMHPDKRLRI